MHKVRYNTISLSLRIRPAGPLLIKSGGLSPDPSLPDMQFVRTYQAGAGETVYIPGSSFKGVVRGFVEKALRTISDRNSWRWACATFETKGKEAESGEMACSQRWKDEKNKNCTASQIYRESCGACRLFGHTKLKGRVAFTDFFPAEAVKTEVRYGVAISRLSHAVAQGPFEMEVAVSGSFAGRLVLENFEIWQLGVLATALQAINHGVLKIGFGKNRGFGEVKLEVAEARLEEFSPVEDVKVIRGLAGFVDENTCVNYGLDKTRVLETAVDPKSRDDLGFYVLRTYDDAGWKAIADAAIRALH